MKRGFVRILAVAASLVLGASQTAWAGRQAWGPLGYEAEPVCDSEGWGPAQTADAGESEDGYYPLEEYIEQAGLQYCDVIVGYDRSGSPLRERRPRQDHDYGLYNYFGLSDRLCRALYGQGSQVGTGELASSGDSLLALAGVELSQEETGGEEYRRRRDELAQVIGRYLDSFDWREMTETERAEHAALYIASHCTYDTGLFKRYLAGQDTEGDLSFTPYGCLVNNKAVCEGISVSYQLLTRAMGLSSFCGPDDQDEAHMFNYVQADGKWYKVDLAVMGMAPEDMVSQCFSSDCSQKVEQILNAYHGGGSQGTEDYDYEFLGPGRVWELTDREWQRGYEQ